MSLQYADKLSDKLCKLSLPAANDFNANRVKIAVGRLQQMLSTSNDEFDVGRIEYARCLLKSISSDKNFVDIICFHLFLHFLHSLEESEDGIGVHAMVAVLHMNPKVASCLDKNNMSILHYICSSFHFSFFMDRFSEDDNEDNPFSLLLHIVLESNRMAPYIKNIDGDCPIHLYIRNALYSDHLLTVLVTYAPACASISSKLSSGKLPIHLLMTHLLSRARGRGFTMEHSEDSLWQCLQALIRAYPPGCFTDVKDTVVRLQLNSGARGEPLTTTWSPYSIASESGFHKLASIMLHAVQTLALETLRTTFSHNPQSNPTRRFIPPFDED